MAQVQTVGGTHGGHGSGPDVDAVLFGNLVGPCKLNQSNPS